MSEENESLQYTGGIIMSKKCVSCGAEIENEVVFCDKCGAKQESPVSDSTAATANPVNEAEKKAGMAKSSIIAIAAVAAVAVVLIIVLCASLVSGGYEKPIKAAYTALNKEDAEKYIKTLPEEITNAYEDVSDEDIEDVVEDSIENTRDYLEDDYGSDLKVKYSVVDTIKLTEDELDDYSRALEKGTDEDCEIKKGYKVALKVTIEGKKEKVQEFDTCVVVKAFGKWVIYSGSPVGVSAGSVASY